MFTIRPATPDDAMSAASLLEELGYKQPVEFFRERLTIFGGKPDELVLVAEQDGSVVGLLAFRAFLYFHEPGKQGRIIALVVSEGVRGGGIGRALAAEAEKFALECNCKRMEVTTGTQREKAHRFYESMGYQETSKRYLKPLTNTLNR
jgi:ribosomal protein S18 acetylase RimI-like enzyme